MFNAAVRFALVSFFAVSFFFAAPVLAWQTERVSIDSSGNQADSESSFASISSDGRYVAFKSQASNLVIGDTNSNTDIFVHDRQTGTTTRVSVRSDGTESNGWSFGSSISADGRYVAFYSSASNLVSGDTNGKYDVFVHDRNTGTTTRVSMHSNGTTQGNATSSVPSISADGRYVVFTSYATNLVTGDTNGKQDAFVHDRNTGMTTRVSVDSSGIQGNDDSGGGGAGSIQSFISADGRYVVFYSLASNLVPGDTNGSSDIFVRDRQLGTTTRVSVDSSGNQGNGGSGNPYISPDGRYVTFPSTSTNLVPDDTNDMTAVFVHDRNGGTTTLVSVDSSGAQGNGVSHLPSISDDGRYVAFLSAATNLLPGDTNGKTDAFVHDRATGMNTLVSKSSSGVQANKKAVWTYISGDGRYVVFISFADNLVPGDTNNFTDTFVHGPIRQTYADFDDTGKSDILWRHTSGMNYIWLINGTAKSGTGNPGGAITSWSVAGIGDFDGDGKADILWRNTTGMNYIWLMNGTAKSGGGNPGGAATSWSVAGIGDFNNDGKSDILWRHTSGMNYIWLMNGTAKSGGGNPGGAVTSWSVAGIGDFEGDGKSDILWRNTTGGNYIWLMNGTAKAGGGNPGGAATSWSVAGIGDFNGDGKSDILWRNTTGMNYIWLMNGTAKAGGGNPGGAAASWSVEEVGDFNNDGKSDILWRHTSGMNYIWLMNGTAKAGGGNPGSASTSWQVMP